MHLAVLVTNTDESAFAARHPRDAAKFQALLAAVRPGWRLSAFNLTRGEFPADIHAFDGLVIGGSPASVHDGDAWIARLLGLIRQAAALGLPMVGACFGHQAIALALGGRVERSPGGWVFGAVECRFAAPAAWMAPDAGPLRLAAAHVEQVTELPPGARVLGSHPGCPISSFALGDRIFTTQNHPEIDDAFIAALVEEYAPKLPPQVAARARASLAQGVEGARFGQMMARFFEQAVR